MACRGCKLLPDNFCYVCGHYVSSKQLKYNIARDTKYYDAYNVYFGMPIGDQDKSWAPHIICKSCRSTLEGWIRGSKRCMPFAIPRIWREPSDHLNDCYFCMVDISKYKKPADRHILLYPDIPSSIAPVLHSEDLPIPKPPENKDAENCESDSDDDDDDWENENLLTKGLPHVINKNELDDLVRDLGLTKSSAELLTSRLKEWNLLDSSCRVAAFRKRHEQFSKFYTMSDSLCYCNDIISLFDEIGIKHTPTEWRLFIDSSSRSLKAVLLHNGNIHPSLPVAHSTQLKEEYNSVRMLLEKIKYDEFDWDVCGDFKMIGFLMGLQGGFTKHPCFLCLWDSRNTSQHYIKRDWPPREDFQPGASNVRYHPLVPVSRILLPPLHIKLGLIKQFVKALNKDEETFKKIRLMFPKLSEAKIAQGIFVGPQVRQMLGSRDLEDSMTAVEMRAWNAFRNVVNGFLGNNKAENFIEIIEELTDSYKALGCRMSLKIHYLHSHLDFFRSNLGDYSEEHGERFHQDMQRMEERYQGRWDEAMMGDYVWGLVRDDSSVHKRQKRSKINF